MGSFLDLKGARTSSGEVENLWSYTSTFPHMFMA
jgi:hypothetical protein